MPFYVQLRFVRAQIQSILADDKRWGILLNAILLNSILQILLATVSASGKDMPILFVMW